MEIAPQTRAKADPQLREALVRATPGELLPVMASLPPDPSPPTGDPPSKAERAAWAQAREEAFARETEELVRTVERAGARDVRRHWAGRSVSARMPPAAIDAAAARPDVAQLVLAVQRSALA